MTDFCSCDGNRGEGANGRLGHGSKYSADTPRRLEGVTNEAGAAAKVHSIVCGPTHTAVITDEGRLFCFGTGANYELGNESTAAAFKPALVPALRDKIGRAHV